MNEIQEASPLVEAPETYEWTVLKRDPKADSVFVGPVWVEVGVLTSETQWTAWAWNGEDKALAEICRLGMDGGGDYMLVCGERALRVTIVAETVYRLATDES